MPEELTSEVQKKQSESVKTEETSEEKTRTEMEMSTGCIKNYVRFQGKRMY